MLELVIWPSAARVMSFPPWLGETLSVATVSPPPQEPPGAIASHFSHAARH